MKTGTPKIIFVLTVAVTSFVACMPLQIGDRKDAVNSSAGSATGVASSVQVGAGAISSVSAFQTTVYPIGVAHCNSCHASINQPFFATSNLQTSHDNLVSSGKVNLDNPALSRLVLRLSQDMHNCWSNCAANATEMQTAIASWKTKITPVATATATATSTATSTVVTPVPVVRSNTIEVLVPANLAGPGELAANFTGMAFPLGAANDTIVPDITAAQFTIEIQKFDAFSYRIRNPKIISPNTAVYVSDLRVAVNGVIRANDTTYSLVDQLVGASNTGTIVSPASMITLLDKGAGVDKLSLSFAAIKSSAAAGCKNLATFQASVKPVFTNSCIRCHNAGNNFDMTTGTDANICARALGRVDLVIPSNSPLIVKPLLGTGHSGGGNLINQTTANSWVTWITSER